jgi:dUTP pyrophosphatase
MKNEYKTDTSLWSNPSTLVANTFNYDFPNRVKIKASRHGLPKKATRGSAGLDLRADILNNITINPGETVMVSTGMCMEIPEGVCAFIMPRSGLAYKHGITIPNTPGLIDSDYRGEICVILKNGGTEPFTIEDGDRIAQMLIVSFITPSFVEVDELGHSTRSAGGFGSTGIG